MRSELHGAIKVKGHCAYACVHVYVLVCCGDQTQSLTQAKATNTAPQQPDDQNSRE